MPTALRLNVIGDREYVYDLSSDFPKEMNSTTFSSSRTLRISKADHIKYLARAKLAGTAIGFGHYIRATENVNKWALEELFKPTNLKGYFIDESGDTADATTIDFLNQHIRKTKQREENSLYSTTTGSYSFNTSIFCGLPRPKPESVKKITWPIP